MSNSVGDDPACVRENRRRAFRAVRRESASAPELTQVHSNRILVARRSLTGDSLPEADGWVTDSSEFTLGMRFADCVPVLLYDPVRRAAGIAHAGWKGTVAKTAAHAVLRMRAEFGCRPEDILAGIGPSIGPDHYVVGEEVLETVRGSFGADADTLWNRKDDGIRLDLWAANVMALREAGVRQIELAGICTACNTADWFSHRAERGRTGRFGAMIWLEPEAA